MIRKLLLLTAAILGLTQSASAIIGRQGRKDSDYIRYGADYPMVCRVGDGMGTLIDSLWVVTAAHVADGLKGGSPYVTFGHRRVGIAKVILHPDYVSTGNQGDLAMVKLQTPVNDIYLAQLYRGTNELGQHIVIVGDGQGGDGSTGPLQGKRIIRAAQNTIDSVSEGWIRYTFDAPPAGDTLEGIAGPGDNGGPAILEVGDSLLVLGVNVYNVGDQFLYGTREYYTRISSNIAWLDGVISGKAAGIERQTRVKPPVVPVAEQPAAVKDTNSIEIPATEDRKLLAVIAALATAVDSQSTARYLSLLSTRLTAQYAKAGVQPEQPFMSLIKASTAHGAINGIHDLEHKGSRGSDSKFPMRPVIVHFVDGYAAFLGLSIDAEGKIDDVWISVRDGICKSGLACRRTHDLSEFSKAPH